MTCKDAVVVRLGRVLGGRILIRQIDMNVPQARLLLFCLDWDLCGSLEVAEKYAPWFFKNTTTPNLIQCFLQCSRICL
jgi:hypothetical protein